MTLVRGLNHGWTQPTEKGINIKKGTMSKEDTPEVTPEEELDGEDVVTVSKEEYDKIVEGYAQEKQARVNLQGEIKDLRKKGPEAQKGEEQPEEAEDEVAKRVREELEKRDAETTQHIRERAIQHFLDNTPMFSEENDPEGKNLESFQVALGKINLSNAKTQDDFIQAFNDALNLLPHKEDKSDSEDDEDASVLYPSTPKTHTPLPKNSVNVQLTPQEQKLVKAYFNGDVEKYVKARDKRPEYYETLMEYVK